MKESNEFPEINQTVRRIPVTRGEGVSGKADGLGIRCYTLEARIPFASVLENIEKKKEKKNHIV